MTRLATRLCAEPYCPAISDEDVPGGWRCPDHQRTGWDRMPAAKRSGYDHKWRRIRDAYLAEHPACERCGQPATEVHHRDHRPPTEPGANDWHNLEALCRRCHRRASSKRAAETRRRQAGS